MRPAARRQWILDYLKLRQDHCPSTVHRVDVLNSDFVTAYILETDAQFVDMPYGAHKCPRLGEDLTALYKQKQLARSTCGLEGLAGMGFPRWVYTYALPYAVEQEAARRAKEQVRR